MRNSRLSPWLRSSLVAALVAVGSLIALPLGPVPVTLQVLVAAVAVLVLTPAEALLALGLYVALGAIGAPVFAGGNGGPGVLLGPTGGFLWGFLAGAPLGALVRTAVPRALKRESSPVADIAALLVFVVVVYLAGWAQFTAVTGRGAAEAFGIAVAPFVLLDLAKAAAALAVARGLRAAGMARA